MLEDFFEGVNEKWQGFLEWSDEKGLPLKGAADWLEEKGLPSLPAFVLILLVIIGGAAFFLMGGTKIFEPKTADVTVTLKGADGLPLSNVKVMLTDAEGTHGMARKEADTDSGGTVLFKDAPVGASLTVTAFDAEGNTLNFEGSGGSSSVVVSRKSEDNLVSLTVSQQAVRKTVSLSVSVTVPESATFLVYDAGTGLLVDDPKTGSSASFQVEPNMEYEVAAQAEGYSLERKRASVGDHDLILEPFALTARQTAVNGNVSVRVSDADSKEGIANASVDVLDAATGKSIARNLKTDEDGLAPVQEIKLGTDIVVAVRASGYPTFSSEETPVEADTVIEAALKKVSKEELGSIRVDVRDSANRSLLNPVVRLYNSRGVQVGEQQPENGSAMFKDLDFSSYYATAFKFGFLPGRIDGAQRGSAYYLSLQDATDENSAKVSVEVSDNKGELVPAASVSLFYEDGKPTGIPEKYTSADGTTGFDGVPLERISAYASAAGRKGSSPTILLTTEGTGETEGINFLRVELKPAPGKLTSKVRDHFSNATVDGAKVDFSASAGAFSAVGSCTTVKGACQLQLLEGFYVAKVTAGGYDEMLSAEFEVKPGVNNKQEFEVVKAGVFSAAKLVYQGAFDVYGNRVSSLSPSTAYNLKFLLTKPPVATSRITAQVRIGSADSSLESEPAEIIGYEAGTAIVQKGGEYPSATIEPTPTPTATPTNSSSAGLFFAEDVPAVQGFKYADFSFQPFEGTKEISVQILTKPLSRASVSVQYRAAFQTSREVIRDPPDSIASPNSLVASMNAVSLPISFGGICEGGICLESHFEGRGGTVSDNYAAEIGETFSLKFRLAAPRGTTVELSAPVGVQSVALQEGVSGDSRARARSGDEQTISLTTSDDNADGEFSIRAQRLSNDIPLKLQARQGESTITRNLGVRVVGSKPEMKLSFSPKSLQALSDNIVNFKLSDQNGLPITDAYVTLGDGSDALKGAQYDGTYSEGKDGSANYRVEGVRPVSVGFVSFKADAEGFRQKRGTIPVTAVKLIEVDAKSVSISIDSREPVQQAFSVNNLLEDSVPVAMAIQLGQTPKYTAVSLDLTSLRLKARQSSSVNLQAALLDSVLQIATRAGTLSEKIVGRVRVSAKLAGSTQEESVPFTIQTSFAQQEFASLWQVSSDSLQFALQPPKIPSDAQVLTVTNDAPYPIVVNHEATLPRIFSAEPLSAVISPGQSAEFTVRARAQPVDPCNTEPDERNASITFHASTQGLTSKRKVSLYYSAKSSSSCREVGAGNQTNETEKPIPACALTTEPSLLQQNQESTVTVAYNDFSPAPGSFSIDCGNGKTANAINCNGAAGTCTAKCRFPSAGSFTVSARSGSTSCEASHVDVESPRSSCALTVEPSRIQTAESATVTINYYDLQRSPNAILVNCGNGKTANAAGCTGATGSCSTKCFYPETGTFFAHASAAATPCSAVPVDVASPEAPEPEPLPESSCAISADPSAPTRNQAVRLTVNYYDLPRAPNVVSIECGNGRTSTAIQCTGTTGSCFANCTYPSAGTYTAAASVPGTRCSSDAIEVAATDPVQPAQTPANGVRLNLPLQLVLQFPRDTKHIENPDGSDFIRLPNGDSMLFEQGSQVGDLSVLQQYSPYQSTFAFSVTQGVGGLVALVPPGVYFTVPPNYARRLSSSFNRYRDRLPDYQQAMADYAWEFRFPFNSFLDFDSQTDFTREGAYQTASIEDYDVTIPINARIIRERTGDQRRAALSPSMPIKIELTPFISSRDAFEVFFPIETIFLPQEFVRIKRDEFNGNKALQFRSGTTISVPADSRISTDAGDFKRIVVPAGGAVRIPAPYALQDFAGRLFLQLPFRVLFKVYKDEQVSINVNPDGYTVRSISNDRVELRFFAGLARAGVPLPDGTRTIEVLPLTQMMFAPAEFGINGAEKAVPAGFSMSLLQNVNVRNVPSGEGSLVEFANGWRMLVEGAQVSEKTPRGDRSLEVLAGTNVVFDRRILREEESVWGQESYSIALPIQSVWHFPQEAKFRARENKITTTSYEASFPGFAPTLSPSENFQDLVLPAGQPIVFTTVDQELAQMVGHDFEFTLPFPVQVSAAQESFSRVTSDPWKNAPMISYRMLNPVELSIKDPETGDVFTTDVWRVMAKDVSDENLDADPIQFTIPETTLFVLRIAPADEAPAAEKWRLKAVFTDEVNFLLPKGVPELAKDSREADLRGCLPVNIKRNKRDYKIDGVKKLIFPSSFKVLPPQKKVGETEEKTTEEQVISVPKNEETIFVLCEKPTKGSLLTVSDDVLNLELTGDLTYKFSNDDSWKTKTADLCVKNLGSSVKRVFLKLNTDFEGVESKKRLSGPQNYLEGDSIVSTKGDVDEAVKSITKPGAWAKDETAMTLNERQHEQDCATQTFSVEMGVPSQFLDEYDCLLPNTDGQTVEGEIRVFAKGTSRHVAHPFKIELSESGTCAGSRAKQLAEALNGFYINYANDQKNLKTEKNQILVFKDVGHVRWVSMLNNYDEDVIVKVSSATRSGTGFVDCLLPKDGVLKSGAGFISECTARAPAKGGVIEFEATGRISGKKIVRTVISDVGEIKDAALKKIFAGTPMGDLALQPEPEMPKPLTPADESKAGTAAGGSGTAPAAGGTPPASGAGITPSPYSEMSFAGEATTPAAPKPGEPTVPYQPASLPSLASATMNCQTNFCTAQQVKKAYEGFAGELAEFIKGFYNAPDDAAFVRERDKFCRPSDPQTAEHNQHGFRKSIVLQVANTRVLLDPNNPKSLQPLKEAAEDAFYKGLGDFGQAGKKKLEVKWAKHGDFDKCGVYIVRARLGLCEGLPGTRDAWLKSSFIEMEADSAMEDPNSFKACEETLPNAALLTADMPEVIIGREPNANAFALNEKRSDDKSFFDALRILSLGPYKEIVSKEDEDNANALVDTLYGFKSYRFSEAVPYENFAECSSNGLKATRSLAIAATPGVLGAAILAFVPGANAYALSRLGNGVKDIAAGATGCAATIGVDTVAHAAGSRVSTCEGINSCLAFQTFSLTDFYLGLLPTGVVPGIAAGPAGTTAWSNFLTYLSKSVLKRQLPTDLATNVGFSALFTAAFAGSNAAFDTDLAPGITPPSTPLVIGSSKVAGGVAALSTQVGSRMFLIDYFSRQGMNRIQAEALVDSYKAVSAKGTAKQMGGILARLIADPAQTKYAAREAAKDFNTLVDGAGTEARVYSYVELFADKKALYQSLTDISSATPDVLEKKLGAFFGAVAKLPASERKKLLDKLFEGPLKEIDDFVLFGDLGRTDPRKLRAFLETATDSRTASEEVLKLAREGSFTGKTLSLDLTASLTPEELKSLLQKYDEPFLNAYAPMRPVNNILKGRLAGELGSGALVEESVASQAKYRAKRAASVRGTTPEKALQQAGEELGSEIESTTKASSRWASYQRMWRDSKFRTAARTFSTIVAVMAPLFFYTEMRPVRAEMDYRLGNHLVVYNNKDGQPASMKEYCFRTERNLNECANRVDTEELCPDASDACVYLTKGTVLAGSQQYNLVTAFNKGTNPQAFITSLFDANTQIDPTSVGDPSRIKTYQDALDFRSPSFKTVTGTEVFDQATITPQSDQQAAETVLETFKAWCDNDGCPNAVEQKLKEASKLCEERRYRECLQVLKLAAGTPAPGR